MGASLRIIGLFQMAFFWVARTGAPWRDLPEEFGEWSAVYRQFRRWTRAVLWEDTLGALSQAKLAPDKLQIIDSTVITAHHHTAGAKGGLRKRLLAVREVDFRPRSISAQTAQAARRGTPDEDRDHARARVRRHGL